MRLVLDTNIIIASLIKDASTRSLLLAAQLELYLPEYALEEIENHLAQISERSGLSISEIRLLLSLLLERIKIVTADKVSVHLSRAEEIIGRIDRDDVPFFALALSFLNDGIWTNDPHFMKQREIKVWTTGDVLRLVRGG